MPCWASTALHKKKLLSTPSEGSHPTGPRCWGLSGDPMDPSPCGESGKKYDKGLRDQNITFVTDEGEGCTLLYTDSDLSYSEPQTHPVTDTTDPEWQDGLPVRAQSKGKAAEASGLHMPSSSFQTFQSEKRLHCQCRASGSQK